MEFLENKTTQVEFENIHTLILAVVLTNKAENAKLNGYGAITGNDEAKNIFTLFDLHLYHIHFKNM